MRIRPVQEILDRRTLKPAVGEEVLFENVSYIVTQVGMRYVHMYRKDDARKFQHLARINEITKVIEPPKGLTGDSFLPEFKP